MAEIEVKRPVPDAEDGEDLEIGFVVDDSLGAKGRFVGIYGHNNTPDRIIFGVQVGPVTRILDLPPRAARQVMRLPAGRRKDIVDETYISPFDGTVKTYTPMPVDRMWVERVFAVPKKGSPSVLSVTETAMGSSTTHNVQMPATVAAGDGLVVCWTNNALTDATPADSGFVSFATEAGAGSKCGYVKPADGDEGGTTIDFHTSSSCAATAAVFRIDASSWEGTTSGCEGSSGATGSSKNPNPDNLTLSGGSADALWIAYAVWDAEDETGWTNPTNYTNFTSTASGTTLLTTRRTLTAAAENPGSYAQSSPAQAWVANTFAILPATSQTLSGSLYSHASSFFAGTIAAIYDLAGSLFQNTPTFPQGAIDTLYDLAGSLFSHPGTFPGGGVVALDNTQGLDGALFANTPSFPQGAIDVGAVALTGSLFANAAVFPQGAVLGSYDLDGSLFVNTSTFYAGSITPSVTITGTLFANTPTFPAGLIETGPVTITGVLFENTAVFPTGVVAPGAVTLVGTLYTHTSSFYVGVVFRPVTHPTGTGETIGGVAVGRTADIIILGQVAGAGGPGSLGGAGAPGKTDSTSGPGSV